MHDVRFSSDISFPAKFYHADHVLESVLIIVVGNSPRTQYDGIKLFSFGCLSNVVRQGHIANLPQ